MAEIVKQQIIEASGRYEEAAAYEGALFERPVGQIRRPTFAEAKKRLGIEGPDSVFRLKQSDAQKYSRILTVLAGLRVMAAVRSAQGKGVYVPGVIINDSGGARIGCLTAAPDVRVDQKEAMRPMTDFQQLLLGKLFAQHQPNAGHHTATGVNRGEVNHAALVASSLSSDNIHRRTHQLVEGGAFSAEIAATGATNVHTIGGIRENNERILGLNQVAGIVVCAANQAPWPLDGDAFDLSAGFTHAAGLTRPGPAPDLKRNLAEIVA